MGSGRPLLLLPGETREPIGQAVAIAWNGSMEATRAASAALPILAKARRVLLLAGAKDVAIEPSLLDLADWLDRHRISGEVRHLDLEGWPVGEQLAIINLANPPPAVVLSPERGNESWRPSTRSSLYSWCRRLLTSIGSGM